MILANFKCKSQYLGYCHVFLEFPGPNGYFQGRTHFFRATLKMQYFEILGKIMIFLCISHFPTSSRSIHSCFSPRFPLSRALNCPCLGVKPKALEWDSVQCISWSFVLVPRIVWDSTLFQSYPRHSCMMQQSDSQKNRRHRIAAAWRPERERACVISALQETWKDPYCDTCMPTMSSPSKNGHKLQWCSHTVHPPQTNQKHRAYAWSNSTPELWWPHFEFWNLRLENYTSNPCPKPRSKTYKNRQLNKKTAIMDEMSKCKSSKNFIWGLLQSALGRQVLNELT